MKLALVALTASAALGLSSTAHAETKSWTALKAGVTGTNNLAVSVDFVPMRSLPGFDSAITALLSSDNDIKEGYELLKTMCSIDVVKVITDVSVVMQNADGADGKAGVIAIGFDGVDQAGIEGCLTKIASKDSKKLTSKKLGKQTQYSVTGEKEKLHMTWIGKNVVAMATDPMDAKAFAKTIGKADKKSKLAGLLAKTSTASPAWVAFAMNEKLPTGGTASGVYAALDIAKDALTLTAHVATSSASEAGQLVTAAKGELPKEAQKLNKTPELAKLLTNAKLASTGADIDISTSIPTASLPALIQQVMQAM